MRKRKSRIDTCGNSTVVRVITVSYQSKGPSCDTKIVRTLTGIVFENDSLTIKLDDQKTCIEKVLER